MYVYCVRKNNICLLKKNKNHSSNYTNTARIMSNCPHHVCIGPQQTLLFHRFKKAFRRDGGRPGVPLGGRPQMECRQRPKRTTAAGHRCLQCRETWKGRRWTLRQNPLLLRANLTRWVCHQANGEKVALSTAVLSSRKGPMLGDVRGNCAELWGWLEAHETNGLRHTLSQPRGKGPLSLSH